MTGNKVCRKSSRVAIAIALGGILVASRFIEPSSLPNICIFRAITGLPCMFCGLTHAFHAISLGNFDEAITYHPLAFLAYGLVVFYFALSCLSIFDLKYPKFIPDFENSTMMKATFVVFTLFWILRIVNASS